MTAELYEITEILATSVKKIMTPNYEASRFRYLVFYYIYFPCYLGIKILLQNASTV